MEACYQRLAKQQQKVKLAFISSGFGSPGVCVKHTPIPAASSERRARRRRRKKSELKVFWEKSETALWVQT